MTRDPPPSEVLLAGRWQTFACTCHVKGPGACCAASFALHSVRMYCPSRRCAFTVPRFPSPHCVCYATSLDFLPDYYVPAQHYYTRALLVATFSLAMGGAMGGAAAALCACLLVCSGAAAEARRLLQGPADTPGVATPSSDASATAAAWKAYAAQANANDQAARHVHLAVCFLSHLAAVAKPCRLGTCMERTAPRV